MNAGCQYRYGLNSQELNFLKTYYLFVNNLNLILDLELTQGAILTMIIINVPQRQSVTLH